jgi:hypothetical protein
VAEVLRVAVMENASCVIRASTVSLTSGGIVALVRSVSAVPLHVTCDLAMGGLAAAAMRHFDYRGQTITLRLVPALLVPTCIHAAYDFLLMLRRRDPSAAWTLRALPLVMAASVALAQHFSFCPAATDPDHGSGQASGVTAGLTARH